MVGRMSKLLCSSELCVVLFTFVQLVVAQQAPPGAPEITGPAEIRFGDMVTVKCTVVGGSPVPTVKWYRDTTVVDQTSTRTGNSVVNDYTFKATMDEHLEVFECQTENGVLQNPLTRTIFVQVSKTPDIPTLTGPTNLISGQQRAWTCTSIGGFPLQQMSMRIENVPFTSNQFTSTSQMIDGKLYTVTGTLNWSPTVANNGQRICCDVQHTTLNSPQTVCTTLTVRSPLAITAPQTSYNPTAGTTVKLNCIVTSGTATAIRWYKNSQLITNFQRMSGGNPNNPPLTITQVQMTDTGTYECEATDGSATVRTNRISVSVVAPLAVNAPQTFYNPTTGTTIQLNCVVTSGTATSIRWYQNGQPITNFQRMSGGNPNNPPLTITQVQMTDAGKYECEATDGSATVRTNRISVSVVEPLAVNAPQTSYSPTEDTPVTLNCIVTSGTATAIKWYKNTQQMQGSARMLGGTVNVPSMTISSVKMTDEGTYECEASDNLATVRTNQITLSPIAKEITEEIIITDILTDYNKLVRPTPSPDVEHSMHPTRIVECHDDKLVLQGYVCMYWMDSRLSWTKGQNSVSLPHDVIWVPDIVQVGEKQKYYNAPVWPAPKVTVTKAGRVGFCPQGFFMSEHCVEKAGEKHQCPMKFRSWSYSKDLMDIHIPTTREPVDLSLMEVNPKCELVAKCAKRNEMTYACCGNRVYSNIMYSIVWQRRRNYCINRSEQPTCN